MELTLSNWGNSLGLRIPKSIAKLMGIERGSKVHVEIKKGNLIISPSDAETWLRDMAAKVDLDALTAKVTPENMPDRSEFEDKPVGREVW